MGPDECPLLIKHGALWLTWEQIYGNNNGERRVTQGWDGQETLSFVLIEGVWYRCPSRSKFMILWPKTKKKIRKAAHAALLELALEGIHLPTRRREVHPVDEDSCYLTALKSMSEGIIEKKCAECYLTRNRYERFMQ